MIISKNWLNEIIDLSNFSTEQICAKLNSIGLEVDSVANITIPDNIVVGYVKNCVKHENSDHLHVCEVDVGNKILQIVCGAKNATADIYVAVAMVGAVMPNGLEIKEAKLRGVQSSGMLCSSTELGLPKINDGIIILDDSIGELILGKELKEYDVLRAENLLSENLSVTVSKALVVPMDSAQKQYAIKVSAALRTAGIKTEVYFEDTKFKNKMQYANKSGIEYAIILGEEEMKTGQITIKNLLAHTQETLPLEKAVELLK